MFAVRPCRCRESRNLTTSRPSDTQRTAGITESILTTHIHAGRHANTLVSLGQATRRFQQCLLENDIALRMGMAAEIRTGPELMTMVEMQQMPFLGKLVK